MTAERRRPVDVDNEMLAFGVILGMAVGGVVTLLIAPYRKKNAGEAMSALTERAREKIETTVPVDPVEESLAVGRATARRRREELGFTPTASESNPAVPRSER